MSWRFFHFFLRLNDIPQEELSVLGCNCKGCIRMVSLAYTIGRQNWAIFSVLILFHHWFPHWKKLRIGPLFYPATSLWFWSLSHFYQMYSQENMATSKEESRLFVESEITVVPSIKQTWLIRNKNVVSLFESEITIVPIVLRSKCDLIQTRMSSYWTKQPNKSWFVVDRVYTVCTTHKKTVAVKLELEHLNIYETRLENL